MVSNEFDLSLPHQQSDFQSRRFSNTNSEHCTSKMIKSKVLYLFLAAIALFVMIICVGLLLIYEKEANVTHSVDAWNDDRSSEQSYWYNVGLDELKEALKVQLNTHRAKNVILFVGDGMGINTATASRIYKYGEAGRLSWEEFPHMGLLKVSDQ